MEPGEIRKPEVTSQSSARSGKPILPFLNTPRVLRSVYLRSRERSREQAPGNVHENAPEKVPKNVPENILWNVLGNAEQAECPLDRENTLHRTGTGLTRNLRLSLRLPFH